MSLNSKKTCFLVFMYQLAQISTNAEFYIAYNTTATELSDFEKESLVPISWTEKISALIKTPKEFDNMRFFFNALYSKALNMPTSPQKSNVDDDYFKPTLETKLGKSTLDIQLTPELIATIEKNRERDREFPSDKRMKTIVDTALVCSQKNKGYDELIFKDFVLQLVPAAVTVHVHDFYVVLYDESGVEKAKAPLPIDKQFI